MDRKHIKAQAKGLMKSGNAVTVSIVYNVILMIFSMLNFKLSLEKISEYYQSISDSIRLNAGLGNPTYQLDPEAYLDGLMNSLPSTGGGLLSLVVSIIGLVISAGFVIFLLHTINGEEAGCGNLFDGFAMFLRIVWFNILQGLFILLWSLLFVIPGIIAIYRYRFGIYLLLEHPEMSAMQCLKESKRLTKGYKGQLFVMDLSFIGWAILSSVAGRIGSTLGLVVLGVSVLAYVVQIWLEPYKGLSFALFYRQRVRLDAADNAGFDENAPDFGGMGKDDINNLF